MLTRNEIKHEKQSEGNQVKDLCKKVLSLNRGLNLTKNMLPTLAQNVYLRHPLLSAT